MQCLGAGVKEKKSNSVLYHHHYTFDIDLTTY